MINAGPCPPLRPRPTGQSDRGTPSGGAWRIAAHFFGIMAGFILCAAVPRLVAAQAPRIVASVRVDGAELYPAGTAAAATHVLRMTMPYFSAAGWAPPALVGAARGAAQILAQCAVRIASVDLHAIESNPADLHYETARSRALARQLQLPRPAVFFVAETLQRPAFEAEAIGRSNSRTRPELADTVWITRGARDLPIVVAHELVHVLMDSGEHVDAPDNLMREETAPRNTRLDAAQCARLRESGTRHGLLQRVEPE